MSEPVVTMRPDESVRVAGERMGHNTVKKLPVTENGRVIGIITTTDIAHFYHAAEASSGSLASVLTTETDRE